MYVSVCVLCLSMKRVYLATCFVVFGFFFVVCVAFVCCFVIRESSLGSSASSSCFKFEFAEFGFRLTAEKEVSIHEETKLIFSYLILFDLF